MSIVFRPCLVKEIQSPSVSLWYVLCYIPENTFVRLLQELAVFLILALYLLVSAACRVKLGSN